MVLNKLYSNFKRNKKIVKLGYTDYTMESEIISEETTLTLPINTGIDFLERVMKAFFEVEAYKKPTNLDELAEVIGTTKPNISSTNKFLEAIGAIEKKSGRDIILTEEGKNYAQSLTWGAEADAKHSFRKLLEDYELTRKIVGYIRVNKNITFDDASKRIGILSGKTVNQAVVRAASNFIQFLIFAEILEEDNEILKVKEKVTKIPIFTKESSELSQEKKRTRKYTDQDYAFTININIDSSMTDDEIARIIKAIRKGFTMPLESENEEDS